MYNPFDLIPKTIDKNLRDILIALIIIQFVSFLILLIYLIVEFIKYRKEKKFPSDITDQTQEDKQMDVINATKDEGVKKENIENNLEKESVGENSVKLENETDSQRGHLKQE
jgi:hypothetical protein